MQKFTLQTKLGYKSLIKGLNTHTHRHTTLSCTQHTPPWLAVQCETTKLCTHSHTGRCKGRRSGCRSRQTGPHERRCLVGGSRWAWWRSSVWASRRRRTMPGGATEEALNMWKGSISECALPKSGCKAKILMMCCCSCRIGMLASAAECWNHINQVFPSKMRVTVSVSNVNLCLCIQSVDSTEKTTCV